VVFNANLKTFAKHWGFRPQRLRPLTAPAKGKTENGVGYVKKQVTAAVVGSECPAAIGQNDRLHHALLRASSAWSGGIRGMRRSPD
jgi:transposase